MLLVTGVIILTQEGQPKLSDQRSIHVNLKYCWSVWSVLVQAVRPSGYQLFINKYAQWPASLLWTLWRNFKFVTATL